MGEFHHAWPLMVPITELCWEMNLAEFSLVCSRSTLCCTYQIDLLMFFSSLKKQTYKAVVGRSVGFVFFKSEQWCWRKFFSSFFSLLFLLGEKYCHISSLPVNSIGEFRLEELGGSGRRQISWETRSWFSCILPVWPPIRHRWCQYIALLAEWLFGDNGVEAIDTLHEFIFRDELETVFWGMKEEFHRIRTLARAQTDQLSKFNLRREPVTGIAFLQLLLWSNPLSFIF